MYKVEMVTSVTILIGGQSHKSKAAIQGSSSFHSLFSILHLPFCVLHYLLCVTCSALPALRYLLYVAVPFSVETPLALTSRVLPRQTVCCQCCSPLIGAKALSMRSLSPRKAALW